MHGVHAVFAFEARTHESYDDAMRFVRTFWCWASAVVPTAGVDEVRWAADAEQGGKHDFIVAQVVSKGNVCVEVLEGGAVAVPFLSGIGVKSCAVTEEGKVARSHKSQRSGIDESCCELLPGEVGVEVAFVDGAIGAFVSEK